MSNLRRKSILLTAGALVFAAAAHAQDDRSWEDGSALYEDDAWYDITEWLDGNDYNPTDEKVGVWDDEVYGNGDQYEWYGNDDVSTDDDWYYDWNDGTYRSYSSSPGSDTYAYTTVYYDYDNDGAFDAYYGYSDLDSDGYYDGASYVSIGSFSQEGKQRSDASEKSRSAPKSASAKKEQCQGTIQSTKTVKVRGDEHTVAKVQKADGKTVVVDLGRSSELADVELAEGTVISLDGPMSMVGDHKVLVAHEVQLDGRTIEIDRHAMTIEGEVQDQRTVKLRDQERLLAVVEVDRDGQQRDWLVDLGAASKLGAKDLKGKQVEVSGVPCEKDGRHLVLAQSVTIDGQQHDIQRSVQTSSSPVEASAQGSNSGRGSKQ